MDSHRDGEYAMIAAALASGLLSNAQRRHALKERLRRQRWLFTLNA